jgi:hypothetical protein
VEHCAEAQLIQTPGGQVRYEAIGTERDERAAPEP